MGCLHKSPVLGPLPIDILVDRPSHHTGTWRPPRGYLLAVEEVAETHVGIVVSLEGWPTQVDVEVC